MNLIVNYIQISQQPIHMGLQCSQSKNQDLDNNNEEKTRQQKNQCYCFHRCLSLHICSTKQMQLNCCRNQGACNNCGLCQNKVQAINFSLLQPIQFPQNEQNQQKIEKTMEKQKNKSKCLCGNPEENENNNQLISSERAFISSNVQKSKILSDLSGTSPKFIDVDHDRSFKMKVHEASQQNNQDQVSTKKDKEDEKPMQIVIRPVDSNKIPIYPVSKGIKLQKLQIPFEVIRLSMKNHILIGLNSYYPIFFERFKERSNPRNSCWRMLQNGTYVNLLQNFHGIFISKNSFYQGFFVQNDNHKYTPDEKGIYIDSQYYYDGQFKLGKVNGKGKLLCRQSLERYEGEWCDGEMISGRAERQNYIYKGQFYCKQASGAGQVVFRQKNIKYKGNFCEGKFEDGQALYDCNMYYYKGGFKKGKKHGNGSLYDKKKKIKITGKWLEDRIVNPSIEHECQITDQEKNFIIENKQPTKIRQKKLDRFKKP